MVFRRGKPWRGCSMYGCKEIVIFEHYLVLSRKWYKIGRYYGMQLKSVSKLLNGTIFIDLERPITQISILCHHLIDAEYHRNGTRCRHSYNGILIHVLLKNVIWTFLSDLAKYSLTRSIVQPLCDS